MEKELDLKMPGVMDLGREELKNVNGGNPFLLLWIAFSVGVLIGDLIAGKNEE